MLITGLYTSNREAGIQSNCGAMIIYRSFYTIAYLGCPLGFQAFARGRRGCGPQATGSPTSIVCRSYALSQRVAPGSCTQSCCSATETDQILTNEQNIPRCPFCCLCCRAAPRRAAAAHRAAAPPRHHVAASCHRAESPPRRGAPRRGVAL